MHLVSCRHRTSGRIDLRNLATRSMRSRTELMFQVVREKRMGALMTALARSTSNEAIRRGESSGLRQEAPLAVWCAGSWLARTGCELAWRGRISGEVNLEE